MCSPAPPLPCAPLHTPQVIVPEKRLIVSEKAVLLQELAEVVQPGDVVEGAIGAVMDWGAFVECRTRAWGGGPGLWGALWGLWRAAGGRAGGGWKAVARWRAAACTAGCHSCCPLHQHPRAPPPPPCPAVNGKPCPRAEAVMPLREFSYQWVATAAEMVKTGQPVRALVLYRQAEPTPKARACRGALPPLLLRRRQAAALRAGRVAAGRRCWGASGLCPGATACYPGAPPNQPCKPCPQPTNLPAPRRRWL